MTDKLFAPPVQSSPAAEKARASAVIASQILNRARQNYHQLCNIQKTGINELWHHPSLTPQEVCDALGTNAGKLFVAHGILSNAIVEMAATEGVQPDILLPTKAFTVDHDGKVTVGTEPYVP